MLDLIFTDGPGHRASKHNGMKRLRRATPNYFLQNSPPVSYLGQGCGLSACNHKHSNQESNYTTPFHWGAASPGTLLTVMKLLRRRRGAVAAPAAFYPSLQLAEASGTGEWEFKMDGRTTSTTQLYSACSNRVLDSRTVMRDSSRTYRHTVIRLTSSLSTRFSNCEKKINKKT